MLSEMLTKKIIPKSEAQTRIELVYKYCAKCKARIDYVKKEYEKWSWRSLWAACCEKHQPWCRVLIDTEEGDWPGYSQNLEECASALESQNELFEAVIVILRRIQQGWAMKDAGKIGDMEFETAIKKLEAKIPEELRGVDEQTLIKWTSKNQEDIVRYGKEIEQAFWTPPNTWVL